MPFIHESIRKRMPKDLQQYVETYDRESIDFSVTERESRDPRDYKRKVYNVGTYRVIVYIGPCEKNTVVVVHFPGGIDKPDVNRDRSWCSNMAYGLFHILFSNHDLMWIDTKSIFACVDYPKISEEGCRRFLVELTAVTEFLHQKCDGIWKEKYDTSSERIGLSSCSFGAYPALISAVSAADIKKPFRRFVAIGPLFDTAPNLKANPWGENSDKPGLTPHRLTKELDQAFERDEREDWTRNPARMPDKILKDLPATVMVRATLDILYPDEAIFEMRLKCNNVKVDSLEVDSIHQVKELYNTKAGREVWEFCKEKYLELKTESK